MPCLGAWVPSMVHAYGLTQLQNKTGAHEQLSSWLVDHLGGKCWGKMSLQLPATTLNDHQSNPKGTVQQYGHTVAVKCGWITPLGYAIPPADTALWLSHICHALGYFEKDLADRWIALPVLFIWSWVTSFAVPKQFKMKLSLQTASRLHDLVQMKAMLPPNNPAFCLQPWEQAY